VSKNSAGRREIKYEAHKFVFDRYQNPADADQIVSLLRKCYDTFRKYDLTVDKWFELISTDSGVKPENAFVVRLRGSGRIVSHVHIAIRQILLSNGKFAKMAGVGNVCTDPDFQGMGLSSKLIGFAHDWLIKKEGIALAALHSGYLSRGHGLYRRLGYEDVCFYGRTFAINGFDMKRVLKDETSKPERKKQRKIRTKVNGFRMMDADGVKRLYKKWCSKHAGSAFRSNEYWQRKYFKKNSLSAFFTFPFKSENFLVARDERKGTAVGYLESNILNHQECFVRELVLRDDEDIETLDGLTLETIKLALGRGCSLTTLFLPSNQIPHRSMIRREFAEFKNDDCFMARVLDFSTLARLLSGKHALIDDDFALDCGVGVLSVSKNGIELLDDRTENIVPDCSVSSADFLALILGTKSALQIARDGGFSFHEKLSLSKIRKKNLIESLGKIFYLDSWLMWPGDHW